MHLKTNISFAVIVCGVVLAVGLIGSSWALSRFMIRIQNQEENTITVKGLAEMTIISDLASFECTVTISAPTLEEGYKKLEHDYNIMKNHLITAGFKPHELEESALSYRSVYTSVRTVDELNRTNYTDVFSHYLFERNIRIVSKDVDLVYFESMALSALMLDGIRIGISVPEYYIVDLEQYKLELIRNATRSAMERAVATAEELDSLVGRLMTARNGIIQITRPASSEISDSGYYDKESRTKIMKIVITATFEAVK